MSPRLIALLGVLVFGGVLANDALFVVNQQEMVVIRQFGQWKRTINEPGKDEPGLHIKLPMIEEMVRLDRRILAIDPPSTEVLMGEDRIQPKKTDGAAAQQSATSTEDDEADQRPRLVIDTFVRYRIVNAREFITRVQSEERLNSLLRPVVDDAVRGVLGRFSLPQLLSEQRAEIIGQIAGRVDSEAARFGIKVEDLRIRRADYPDQALLPVFNRMRSERERVTAQTLAEGEQRAQAIRASADRERAEILAEARKQAQTLRGEADNEAISLLGAVTNKDPNFYGFYRSLQAYRTALTPDTTTMVLSPDSPFFRYFGSNSAPK